MSGCWDFISKHPRVDHHKTLSPIVKPATVRLILSLVVSFCWSICPLDVKNAFLHGILTEDVHMKQPPGFAHLMFPTHVCKPKKAIYGLKQAPQAWFHHFSSFLMSCGFACSSADPSMFLALVLILWFHYYMLMISFSQVVVLQFCFPSCSCSHNNLL